MDTRTFRLIGGPLAGERIELRASRAQGLVGADGKALNSTWPSVLTLAVKNEVFEELDPGTEGPVRPGPVAAQETSAQYIQRHVVAAMADGDVIQWTVYAHESMPMTGELARDILTDLWGLL